MEAKSYLQSLDSSPVEVEAPEEATGIPAVTADPIEGVPEPGDNIPQAQAVPVQEWFDNDATRYQWDVELVVEPPVDAAILL